MQLYIAADPGFEGAMAAIDEMGRVVSYNACPRIGDNGPVDTVAEYVWLKELMAAYNPERIVLMVEDVHPIHLSSASSTGKLMQSKGELIGLFTAISYENEHASFELIQPKDWQKKVWTFSDRVTKANKVDTKKTSLSCAKRLWPQEKFLKNERCRSPHDGIVDALLIAEAGRRRFLSYI